MYLVLALAAAVLVLAEPFPIFGDVFNVATADNDARRMDPSAARNTAESADCPATDQRGIARPQFGGCDLGAFEAQGESLVGVGEIRTPTSTPTAAQTPTNTASISPSPTNTSTSLTTTRGASILFFPALIADETRDSVIQITNLVNSIVQARCFYLSSNFLEADFSISLVRLQPTQWTLSRGRVIDPDDECGSEGRIVEDCSGAGIDPGFVPPVPQVFRGALLCVETDVTGNAIGGNHLRGQATILDRRTAGVGKYSAIGFVGSELAGKTGRVLRLEGKVEELKGQYDACPESWILNHATDSAGNGVESRTCLTVAACSLDLESQEPETVHVEFVATNDLAQTFTASTTISSWSEICLSDLDERFLADASGASHVQTRIRSSDESAGIVVVAGTMLGSDQQARQILAAGNPQSQGARRNPDIIVLPEP